MNGKELKAEILNGLKNGKTKNELYDELYQAVDDNLLRRILASRPSQNTEKKFLLIHKIIYWFWILFFLLELVGTIMDFDLKGIISLVISAYLLIQLWKFNGEAYLPAIFWLFFGIFNAIKELLNLPKNDLDYDSILIFLGSYILLIIIIIGLMYNVRNNVFGYYNWFNPARDDKNNIIFQKE